jgi:hypothetical protein
MHSSFNSVPTGKKAAWSFNHAAFLEDRLSLTHLGEALATINGTIGLGLEGNLCLAAAGGAGGGEILAGAAGSSLAGIAAALAALGLILEAALCIELLLTRGEHKVLATLFAY